jgi:UDP-N-acetylmuramoyl-tripeptide--D-alanyl-D-alanine ligase
MTRTQPLWTGAEAARATHGEITENWQAGGVSIDSRTLKPGELFIALAGPNHDGHDHVAEALGKGAAAAMVHREPADLPARAPLLIVADTMAGLEALGRAGRERTSAKIAAITGSVGKTGTKEMLARALALLGRTAHSAGSLNNHWGVPLSLARLPRNAAYGVLELGMNHAGELTPLSRMVRPHVAVITTIAPVHIEFFESLEKIAEAKAEIFAGVEPGGAAVLNRDIPHYDLLAERAREAGIRRIYGFGEHPDAEIRLRDYRLDPRASRATVQAGPHEIDFMMGMPGRHWLDNALAVLGTVLALGGDPRTAAGAFAGMRPPKGRGERHLVMIDDGVFELIDDSNNASPVSVAAAIEVLAAAPTGETGKHIAVLGDMLELGAQADDLHRGLAEPLIRHGIDRVYACGPHMAALFEALPETMRGAHTADSVALVPLLCEAVGNGDVVMVKGSFGSRMARVVEALLAIGATPSAANGG